MSHIKTKFHSLCANKWWHLFLAQYAREKVALLCQLLTVLRQASTFVQFDSLNILVRDCNQ